MDLFTDGRYAPMPSWLYDLIDSDMPTAHDRDRYLGFASSVMAGHHGDLEITGNAFNVHFSQAGVRVQCLWDESRSPECMGLAAFIQALTAPPGSRMP